MKRYSFCFPFVIVRINNLSLENTYHILAPKHASRPKKRKHMFHRFLYLINFCWYGPPKVWDLDVQKNCIERPSHSKFRFFLWDKVIAFVIQNNFEQKCENMTKKLIFKVKIVYIFSQVLIYKCKEVNNLKKLSTTNV